MKYLTGLLLLGMFSPTIEALTTDVKVDKIRYCRTIWPLCNDKLQDDYHWWENSGVPDQIQKNTYLGRYNEPERSKVEHLVLLSSGQRFTGGYDNLITGQPDFSAFGKRDSHRNYNISTDSIAYQLFDRDIYHEENTFMALAFDARFNWGFSNANKNDIVDAYFDWLKSKVYTSKLKSVYLGGHSRGGALVMRLAQKFQAELPDVLVIVHGFDPVVNRSNGELGAYNSSINNPIAGFPRDTVGLNNLGNWAWKNNMITQYPNTNRLSVFNFLSGGQIFGLAQEVRAVTHQTGTEEILDLDWYYQQWFHLSSENSGGHSLISKNTSIANQALNHVQGRLAHFSVDTTPTPIYYLNVSCNAAPRIGYDSSLATQLTATASTTDPDDTIVSYDWSFGSPSTGTTTTGAGPHSRTFYYQNGKTYIPNSVTVTTSKGKTKWASCPVIFVPSDDCSLEDQFDDGFNDPQDQIDPC